MVDFSYIDFKKILNKNFDIIFSGTPILARRRMVPPKMSAPGLPMTPLFNAESFSTLKVGMFAIKQSLINLDQDMRVLD